MLSSACSLPLLYWGLAPNGFWTSQGSSLAKAFCLLLPHQSSLPPCPLPLTSPLLFPKFHTADTASLLGLADSFFQHSPEMEFLPSGPKSIMFCQNLVLKITAAENYQSVQSSRKTQFSSQERNLSFPFFPKFLKSFFYLSELRLKISLYIYIYADMNIYIYINIMALRDTSDMSWEQTLNDLRCFCWSGPSWNKVYSLSMKEVSFKSPLLTRCALKSL